MGIIQMKNVPDDLHDELRRRASRAGMTVRDYVIALIARDQSRPTLEEWLEEIASDPPVDMGESPAEAVRAGREERERELEGRNGGGHGGSGR
jgi:antitoxin FitA